MRPIPARSWPFSVTWADSRYQNGILAEILLTAAILLSACTSGRVLLAAPDPATLAAVQTAAPHPCNTTTAAALDAYRIPPAQIRAIYYDTRRTGNERTIIQSYDAWISLTDQRTDLVVRHSPDCGLLNVHTRGGVGMDGIPAYHYSCEAT